MKILPDLFERVEVVEHAGHRLEAVVGEVDLDEAAGLAECITVQPREGVAAEVERLEGVEGGEGARVHAGDPVGGQREAREVGHRGEGVAVDGGEEVAAQVEEAQGVQLGEGLRGHVLDDVAREVEALELLEYLHSRHWKAPELVVPEDELPQGVFQPEEGVLREAVQTVAPEVDVGELGGAEEGVGEDLPDAVSLEVESPQRGHLPHGPRQLGEARVFEY